jgi:hypothetical protein
LVAETARDRFGWSDAAAGWLGLGLFGLLVIAAASRREAGPGPRPLAPRRPAAATTRPAWPMLSDAGGDEAGRQPVAGAAAGPLASAGRAQPPLDLPVAGSRRGSTRSAAARNPLPPRLRFRILARDGFRCRYCGQPGSAPDAVLQVDHVVPRVAGAGDDPANLLTACADCNLGKGDLALPARAYE